MGFLAKNSIKVEQVPRFTPLRTQLLLQLQKAKFRIQERNRLFQRLTANTPFHCQLDGARHPATKGAYQCIACGRIICEDCYDELLSVHVQGCPHCEGKLTLYSVGK